MSAHNDIEAQMIVYNMENAKFESGNSAAGTRARKALAELAKAVKARRNEITATKKIIVCLKQNQRWAYISDAGTPGISDPGAKLVAEVQRAGLRVLPIPGASALTAIASVGGGALDHLQGRFQFIGFLPHKASDRAAVLSEINLSSQASIFLESPHQIKDSLLALAAILGPERDIIIGRELTKKFEAITYLKAGAV